MSITLNLVDETNITLIFELPSIVKYAGKTVGEFNMNSPSGLIRALNSNQQKLHEIFIGKENFTADWNSARIHRKQIWVRKFASKNEEIANRVERKEKLMKNKSYRDCAICGIRCQKSKKMLGCCSEVCYKQKRVHVNEILKKNHWCSSSDKITVQEKRIETRKKNDHDMNRTYTPWNKGKKGEYSLETIEKIRNATRLQFHKELFKKTSIEKKIEAFLKDLNVNFKYSFILSGRQYDFVLHDVHAIIETHGDFWHANPKFWGEGGRPMRDHQIMKRQDDKIKERIARDNGYEYFAFWENDINNNWEDCVKKIAEILNGNYKR